MATINLLYKHSYPINEHISINIPTVGEIIENEDAYYSVITMLTAMPIDLMVQLDDMGIDFSTISEYDLFLILFRGLQMSDTSLVLGDLDLSKFVVGYDDDNKNVVLVDPEHDIVIDKRVHAQIAATIRKIHRLEKNTKKPGNTEAKEYMLERARIKAKRHRKTNSVSQLESLIVAMVNTEQFKYDYETVKNLTIYQFNESVHQIIRKEDYEHKMIGIYTGNIRVSDLDPDDLNWLTHK